MKRLRIFFLSAGVVFFIIALSVIFVIFPIYHRHVSLEKEERMLNVAEKKSTLITRAMAINSEKTHLLQGWLQDKAILPFIEDALNASQLAIESIKPNQGNEHNVIHLIIKGEYRALLNFLSLLAQQPNSLVFMSLIIEKDRMEVILKNDNEKIIARKIKLPSNFLKRLTSALAAIDVPVLKNSTIGLSDVQSPFASRILFVNKKEDFYSLKNTRWNLSGDVRRNDTLLGVFLEAEDHSQSRYFGIDLPWENSHWRIVNITRHAVIFEESRKHLRWSLSYSRFKQSPD